MTNMNKPSLKSYWKSFFFEEMGEGRYMSLQGELIPKYKAENSLQSRFQRAASFVRRPEVLLPLLPVFTMAAISRPHAAQMLFIDTPLIIGTLLLSYYRQDKREKKFGLQNEQKFFDKSPKEKTLTKEDREAAVQICGRSFVTSTVAVAIGLYFVNKFLDSPQDAVTSSYLASSFLQYGAMRSFTFTRYAKVLGLTLSKNEWDITSNLPEQQDRIEVSLQMQPALVKN